MMNTYQKIYSATCALRDYKIDHDMEIPDGVIDMSEGAIEAVDEIESLCNRHSHVNSEEILRIIDKHVPQRKNDY